MTVGFLGATGVTKVMLDIVLSIFLVNTKSPNLKEKVADKTFFLNYYNFLPNAPWQQPRRGMSVNHSVQHSHNDIRLLYRDWATQNALPQLLRIHLIAIVFALFLLVTDFFLWGEDSSWFRPYRLAIIALLAINTVLLFQVKAHHRYRIHEIVAYCASFTTAASWHTMYLYFLLEGPTASQRIVLAAMYMTVFIVHFVYQDVGQYSNHTVGRLSVRGLVGGEGRHTVSFAKRSDRSMMGHCSSFILMRMKSLGMFLKA